ncbi:hypothetical protein VR45_34330 [Streptomyces sp. NRRL S-495]|nr:hypothetical protein VR45_34330 [Streptomyces sp. NRRL S-495]
MGAHCSGEPALRNFSSRRTLGQLHRPEAHHRRRQCRDQHQRHRRLLGRVPRGLPPRRGRPRSPAWVYRGSRTAGVPRRSTRHPRRAAKHLCQPAQDQEGRRGKGPAEESHRGFNPENIIKKGSGEIDLALSLSNPTGRGILDSGTAYSAGIINGWAWSTYQRDSHMLDPLAPQQAQESARKDQEIRTRISYRKPLTGSDVPHESRTHVYMMTATESRLIKIGVAKNPMKRMTHSSSVATNRTSCDYAEALARPPHAIGAELTPWGLSELQPRESSTA